MDNKNLADHIVAALYDKYHDEFIYRQHRVERQEVIDRIKPTVFAVLEKNRDVPNDPTTRTID